MYLVPCQHCREYKPVQDLTEEPTCRRCKIGPLARGIVNTVRRADDYTLDLEGTPVPFFNGTRVVKIKAKLLQRAIQENLPELAMDARSVKRLTMTLWQLFGRECILSERGSYKISPVKRLRAALLGP